MSSLSSLPEDVQVDIFLRLPDNSISVCRCVCKPWCNLLYKPSFIKNHLNQSILSNRRFMLTIDENNEMYFIDYDPKSSLSSRVVGNRAVHVGYPFWDKNIKTLVAVGSCNGLVCLGISSGRKRIDEKSCICVWNPLTCEYQNIEIPVNDFNYSSESSFCVRYGFGYDNNIDDYKLVRILDNEIRIYTLGSKSWKTTQCTERYMFPGSNSHRLNIKRRLSGVLHNGALHWLGVPTQGTSSEVIVSFNINNETFMDLPFPEEALPPLPGDRIHKDVGVFGDCLCVVVFVVGFMTEVWVMQDYGVRESWVKQFTINGPSVEKISLPLMPRCYQYSFSKPTWSLENGEILIDEHRGLVSYDQSNGITRLDLVNSMATSRYIESYVKSLAYMKSGTYVEKRTTNGDQKKRKRQTLR